VDEAEIAGRFEGTLMVTGRLFVRSTGRIVGTLGYGEIEIERGGQITGDIGKDRATAETRAARPAAPERAPANTASSELVRIEARSPSEIEHAKSVLAASKNSPIPAASRLGWKK
jgi:cytoskeletal protein CcmA (bactofilin family)